MQIDNESSPRKRNNALDILVIATLTLTVWAWKWHYGEDSLLAGANIFGTYVLAPIGIIAIPAIILSIPYYYLWYLPKKAVGHLKRK